MAERARQSFNERFWRQGEHLFDVIDGEQGDDASFRPNQIFSIALEHPILDESRWRAVVDAVGQKLLTPVGLRSFVERSSRLQADVLRRPSSQRRRVSPGHRLGLVDRALYRRVAEGLQGCVTGARHVGRIQSHLLEDGIGTVSEIFDAEPPFHPRGCIAQAWSVAEVLRACQKTFKSTIPSSTESHGRC